ncbi:hypothetical protein MTO96_025447 [Rhipicephalus appendiculatus]
MDSAGLAAGVKTLVLPLRATEKPAALNVPSPLFATTPLQEQKGTVYDAFRYASPPRASIHMPVATMRERPEQSTCRLTCEGAAVHYGPEAARQRSEQPLQAGQVYRQHVPPLDGEPRVQTHR